MLLQLNEVIYWEGSSAEDRETLWIPRGFLPMSHKVPAGLAVPHGAGKAGQGCLFDLLCPC